MGAAHVCFTLRASYNSQIKSVFTVCGQNNKVATGSGADLVVAALKDGTDVWEMFLMG